MLWPPKGSGRGRGRTTQMGGLIRLWKPTSPQRSRSDPGGE